MKVFHPLLPRELEGVEGAAVVLAVVAVVAASFAVVLAAGPPVVAAEEAVLVDLTAASSEEASAESVEALQAERRKLAEAVPVLPHLYGIDRLGRPLKLSGRWTLVDSAAAVRAVDRLHHLAARYHFVDHPAASVSTSEASV